jgi:hypothetical protein
MERDQAGAGRQSAQCSSKWLSREAWAPFCISLIAVIAYQNVSGTFDDDFYYGDTAAHFVTGVMIADYVSTSLGSDPVAFAEEYYVRSPKVAFGRWPPLFHLLQSGWYLITGASKQSALILIGAITAATIAVLFHRLRRLYGTAIAFAAVLLFASFPNVRWHTRMVMSDMLTLLLCTLSVFALIDFVSTRRTRDLLAVFVWAFLAVLTKENALHLAILVPCVLGFAVGRPLFRHPQHRLIVLSVITVGIGLVVFRLLFGSNLHGYQDLAHLVRQTVGGHDRGSVFVTYSDLVSSAVVLIAAAGLIAGYLSCHSGRKTHVMVSLTWLLSIFAFFIVVPAPPDVRYFMPALIPLTLLVGQALYESHERLRRASRIAAVALPAAIWFVAVYSHPYRVPPSVWGYEAVARSIPVRSNLVTMISSDPFGDGAFIVERLMADRERAGIVLRADKVLASSDWHGDYHRLITNSARDVYRYLLETPVHYVVVETSELVRTMAPLEHTLLSRTLESHPDDFRLVGRFPRYHGTSQRDSTIAVYENVSARHRRPESIRVTLNHTLGRSLELKLNGPKD